MLNGFDGLVAWLEEQARALLGIDLVCLQLYLVPVYLIRALCKGNMRYQTAVAHQDDSGNLAGTDGLITTLIDLTALIVYPLAFGQVDRPLIA